MLSPASRRTLFEQVRGTVLAVRAALRHVVSEWRRHAGEPGRYSDTHVALLQRLSRSPLWPLPAAGLLGLGFGLGPRFPELDVVAILVALVTAVPYIGALRLHASDEAWIEALRQTDPNRWIEPEFPLCEREYVVYQGPSVRIAEQLLGFAGQAQSRQGAALRNAVLGGLVGGRLGFVAGALLTGRQAALTPQFGLTPLDTGTLTVTSQRVIFLGHEETIVFGRGDVLRWRIFEDGRVVADHPARTRGESFSVHPLIFQLAMARRDLAQTFEPPLPPKPLPLSRSVLPRIINAAP